MSSSDYSFSTLDPPPIDTTNPEASRGSFSNTNYDSIEPLIHARFPNIDPLYITKTFRGTIRASGLVWFDVDRDFDTPADFKDLGHMLYCFEVYGQIVCMLAGPQVEFELQRALSDYRLRLLKLGSVATFESLREWHKAFLETRIRQGQDDVGAWRGRREDLAGLLVRK